MSEEHYDFNDEDTGKRFKKLTLAQRKRFKDYREVLKQFDVSYDDLAFHLFELKEIVEEVKKSNTPQESPVDMSKLN